MSPRTRTKAVEVELPLNVREGVEEALRGETVALTDDEAERYFETGELPEHVWLWADERSSSRRVT
jgi:predicted AAA+ superfamily ATPase